MSDFNRGYPRPAQAGAADMAVDAGLRAFMLGVYNKVGLGLVISAALAYLTSSVPAARDLLFQQVMTAHGMAVTYTLLGWIVAIAPLPILLFASFSRRQSPATSGLVYWLVVALFGASLGVWALLYTGASIFMTFLITAAAFGGLSLVGYTTKRDLSGFGSFLIVGLIGLIIASLVNMFLALPGLYFAINVVGVLIFAGLIAFDTQRLKLTYYQLGGNEAALGVATNYGALSLYLDFLNLFLFLLRLMGQRR
ncbi:MAG TPA: Bax inhibitor-1/YccA family protein [Caulobacteraceae bacterium]|nr:Bax inhibitor-1/YccA family protein [Caulobacteraceae bacterium]